MTAGAIVLAVIAPVVESADRPADAGANPPNVAPQTAAETPDLDPAATLGKRAESLSERPTRARRPAIRRTVRAVAVKRVAKSAVKAAVKSPAKAKTSAKSQVKRKIRQLERRPGAVRRDVAKLKPRRVKTRTFSAIRPGMGAVIAFARSQVGKGYASGAEGPSFFDCSGLTKSAYARAGITLPHSSGGQAARARSIPRSLARPGDLVVGPGHVGIYMGGGMMIDAGNRRTGVVYRGLYAGLHVERL